MSKPRLWGKSVELSRQMPEMKTNLNQAVSRSYRKIIDAKNKRLALRKLAVRIPTIMTGTVYLGHYTSRLLCFIIMLLLFKY